MNHKAALVGVHVAVLLFGFRGVLFGRWLDMPPVWIVLGPHRRPQPSPLRLAGAQSAAEPMPSFDVRMIGNGVVLAVHWGRFFFFFAAIRIAKRGHGPARVRRVFPLFVLILERVPARPALVLPVRPADSGARHGRARPGWWPEFRPCRIASCKDCCGEVLSGFTFALLAVDESGAGVVSRAGRGCRFFLAEMAGRRWPCCRYVLPARPAGGRRSRNRSAARAWGIVCTALCAHSLFISSLRGAVRAHGKRGSAALEPVYGNFVLAPVATGRDTRMGERWAGRGG